MKTRIKLRAAIAAMGVMAFFIGATPVTAFAQTKEAKCICEDKCTEDCVNEECEVCSYDYTYCEGKEKVIEEHWGPLTPDGNLELVDDYGSLEAGGKQFITVVTKAGNYFYIIIDRDDNGTENVHFLNLVDESDLLSLMDDEEAKAYIESMQEKKEPEPVVEEPVTPEPPKEEVEKEKPKANVNLIMTIVLIAAIAGIGGYLYMTSKKIKPKQENDYDPDADYFEDEDDDDDDYMTEVSTEDSVDKSFAEESEDES